MLYEEGKGYIRSIAHSAYQTLLPTCPQDVRPRTLFYTRRTLSIQLTQLPLGDPDIQVVDLQSSSGEKLRLINVYNEKDSTGKWTAERSLYDINLTPNSIVVGDFNTRHANWDPFGNDRSTRATNLLDWIESKELHILNLPEEGTFFRSHIERPSVLDLTLAKGPVSRRASNWRTLHTGSDHLAICIDLHWLRLANPTEHHRNPAFNTAKADWDAFATTIQELARALVVSDNLDKYAANFSDIILQASNSCIPRRRTTPQSKPWWTPALRELRRILSKAQRTLQAARRRLRELDLNPVANNERDALYNARNRYFQAVKDAKRAHWNKFLEKTDPKSIFKAMAYTKLTGSGLIPTINGQDTFEGKSEQLRSTLFPKPPNTDAGVPPLPPRWQSYQVGEWKWELLGEDELQAACSSSKVKGTTPGPDGITQEIISRAYTAIPQTFLQLYQTLLTRGHQPLCWRQAIGVILPKPNKPNYAIPKAYRIICLLNCLRKVSERLLAHRLSQLAEMGPLLHNSQMGGRPKRSAVDTAMLFTDFVKRNKAKGHKTSAVFLDIKGAFDHIQRLRLLRILIQKRLPYAIVS